MFFFRFNHPHSIHNIAYYIYIYVAPGYEAALELSLSLQRERERETERERGEKKGITSAVLAHILWCSVVKPDHQPHVNQKRFAALHKN